MKSSRVLANIVLVVLVSPGCEWVAGIHDRKVAPASLSAVDGSAGGDSLVSGDSAGTGFFGTGDATSAGDANGVGGSLGALDMAANGGAPGGDANNTGGVTGKGGIPTEGGVFGTGGDPGAGGIPGMGGMGGIGPGVIGAGGTDPGWFGTGGVTGTGGTQADAWTQPDVPLQRDTATDPPGCPALGILGTGTGLLGEYFLTPSLTGLAFERIDASIDFSTWVSLDRSLPADNFSIRWTGQVQPRFSGRYTFYTLSDDGIRLWIDGNLIVDEWVSHAPTEKSGTADLVAGQKYNIKVEYFEGTGLAQARLSWASDCQAREVIPPSQLYPPTGACTAPSIGTGNGLKGDYFDNQDLTAFKAARTDDRISFVWPDGTSPMSSIAPGTYSVRWTGQVQATHTGWTTFYLAADDGVRLFIDDNLVIDDWASHAATENQATRQLVAGQKYNLRLEYFEQGGGGQVELLWGGACQPKEIIPKAQLFTSYTGVDCGEPTVGTGTGLTGDYYNNNDFTNLVLTRQAEVVDFNWGAGSPNPAIGADTFSVRWTGKILAEFTGPTTFWVLSDDAAMLRVDGQPIVNDWTGHNLRETAGVIDLIAGQTYDIRLDYREEVGNAQIALSWSWGCQAKQIVPITQLIPSASPDAGVVPPDAGPDLPDAAPDVIDVAPDAVDAAPDVVDAAPDVVDAAPDMVDVAPDLVDSADPALDTGESLLDTAVDTL